MRATRYLGPGVLIAAAVTAASAHGQAGASASAAPTEGGFAALQARGERAMGVDQNTSTHRFDALPYGGRIELQRDVEDPTGVDDIRRHLATIATAFALGDFSTPAFVHMREVPGAEVMAARSERIRYIYADLPRGGELRIVTSDAEALRAIHEFMSFQRTDHRAGGIVPDAQQVLPHGVDHDPTHHEGMHGHGHPAGATHGPDHVRPVGRATHGPDHVKPVGGATHDPDHVRPVGGATHGPDHVPPSGAAAHGPNHVRPVGQGAHAPHAAPTRPGGTP